MVRGPLDVDEPSRVAVGVEALDEPDERHLRRVAHRVEHRLPGEQAPDRHAVQTADEAPVLPRLDAVRPAQLVQPAVRAGHLRGDPPTLARGVRTPADDLVERGVDAHLEAVERPAQRPAHAQPAGRDHAPGVGRPPAGGAAAPGPETHGEQPEPVGPEERARLEVGAGGDEVLARLGAGRVEQPGGGRRLDGGMNHRERRQVSRATCARARRPRRRHPGRTRPRSARGSRPG